MKPLFLFLVVVVATAGLLKIFEPALPQAMASGSLERYRLKNVIRCSPDLQALQNIIEQNDIPPMPGAGTYKWNITKLNDSSQFYFNQGINMYYGFHIIESLASFKKAAKFDPGNPMVWWAQALSFGPNINDVAYEALPQALQAISKAGSLQANATAIEKELIRVMSVRYSTDSTQTREKLNREYKYAMQAVYEKYPTNADVAALYVDAMMVEHPWELWNADGSPEAWTPLIRSVLERALITSPEHPGLNHYYIHVMEASPFPEKATASADRLGKLSPGLSHIVHMPSHIYLRTGNYIKGYTINEQALDQYNTYLDLYPAVAGSEFLYRLHNEHMLINCAMHAGRKKYTIDKSLDFQKTISAFLAEPGAMGNYLGYIYMIPTLTMVRFEDWDGLLNAPAIQSSYVYASLLSHFGRGMAFANRNNLNQAQLELGIVKDLIRDSVLKLPFTPFSPAIDGAMIAEEMLQGTIALKKGAFSEAIKHFTGAVLKEKAMVYNEPRDWLLNPGYYLADAYYQAGKWKEAEKAFMGDLKDNNENVWSLAGLYKTLMKQKRNAEAGKVEARLKKAAVNSDVNLYGNKI